MFPKNYRGFRYDLYIYRSNYFDINNANKKWMEVVMGWWFRFISLSLWLKFVEWRLSRQSKKFAEELKRKNYKPREPWDNGIWK